MMKKLFLFASFPFIFSFTALGQDNPSSKNNELSLDLLTFTRNTKVPGIIYKRKGEAGAFRLKLNTAFDFDEVSNTASSDLPEISNIKTTDEVSSFDSQIFIGYEWNKHLQAKWTIFYGADFVWNLSQQTTTKKEVYKRTNGAVDRIVTNENEVSSSKFGLSPFVGCNYYFNESISIGIESYVLSLFGGEEVTSTLTEQSSTGTAVIIDSSSPSTILFDLNPNTLLTIGYRF